MNRLPPGWSYARIDRVARVQGGIQKQGKRRPVKNRYPFLRVANVLRGKLDLSEVHEVELFDGELERYQLEYGDLLVVEGNGSPDQIGRAAVWDETIPECVHQNHLIRVRPSCGLLPKYLAYAWNSPKTAQHLRDVAGSTSGLYTLSTAKVKAVEIPMCPVDEQQRIVDLLEDHLSRIDAATTGLFQADQRTAAYKAAAAVTELEAAGGEYASLASISTAVRNGIFVSRAKPEPNGVPILRIGAVRPLLLDLTDLRYSERDRHDLATKDALLNGGDLLFTRYNGNPRFVGACAMVPYGVSDLTYPDKLIRVQVDRNIAEPGFVALACSFGEGRRQIQSKVKTTSGQAGVSGTDLKRIAIRIPDLPVQGEVMKRVQEALDHADRIAAATDAARRRSASLRRALLDAAFSGRLTGRASDINLDEELAGV
ncbi:restriction endonuclease subunit S [Micromonospora sp. NPDC048909]|uniref:restriction endonuclease subunit S n=1 Tax=Micromonospora sp. NPDC048909 TaxID=3155643 RepID=UPI0033EE8197